MSSVTRYQQGYPWNWCTFLQGTLTATMETMCKCMFQFNELRKKETAPYEMQMLFLEHLWQHADSIQIYTDGSKVEEGVGYEYVTGDWREYNEC